MKLYNAQHIGLTEEEINDIRELNNALRKVQDVLKGDVIQSDSGREFLWDGWDWIKC
tara:strand:+ start:359 stop:529 length:171 start_codon:yes stop_codon:yes gene_type:complete